MKKSPVKTSAASVDSNDGVYISLETLLALAHSFPLRSKSAVSRMRSGLSGENLSKRKGPGIEFEDVRPYLPGDDLRFIDWRVAARTGMPYTRRYTEDVEHQVMIVCDQRVNMFFGSGASFKSYNAALLAAQIAWLAFEQAHRLAGVIASETLEVVSMNSPRRTLLAFCNSLVNHNNSVSVDSRSTIGIDEVLDCALSRLKPGMTVSVVSDFNDLDDSSAHVLAAIAARSKLILRRVTDPLETSMSVRGCVGITDGNQSAQVVVNNRARQAYTEKREKLYQRLNELVVLSGATLVDSDSGAAA